LAVACFDVDPVPVCADTTGVNANAAAARASDTAIFVTRFWFGIEKLKRIVTSLSPISNRV
jgi:hypothetical protein